MTQHIDSNPHNSEYHIGTPGQKWQPKHVAMWLAEQTIKRSYVQQVVNKIDALSERFEVIEYGQLNYTQGQYPLYALIKKSADDNKPWVLVTGGVHGYETSGVQGALRFAETEAERYSQQVNLVILPCISPWGYETINRWNESAIDPNRSFYSDSPAPESEQAMAFVHQLGQVFLLHIDLHETTDSDNSEFRPALAARDAIVQKTWNIPDGFYLVADSDRPEPQLQKAIIDEVAKVTHIALADEQNKLIGVDLEQFGVINYAAKKLGLCMGLTNAPYVTTTEVYPDSPKVDDENCILAQVAAITGALDYVLSR
ncbi:M14 family metallocarboxypeptidase [Thalassotalea ponticola]|uniref:M14 family metallopeptidase n=1 Tax=Thalassotalea ponticola TaxID=1523392 RepID=UPI0025B5DC6D|nr:M14 family metallocarboxypeptidase [Thalassotalea ponticola]MDN3651801.1 M14 family metallocarboxypeptidase [Thalassotalea ponticola]